MNRLNALAMMCMMLLCIAARAQPTCRVYKTFRTVSSSAELLDTIQVVDDFPVASVKVSSVSLVHPDVPALELSLLHKASADALTPIALVPSGDAYVPATGVNGGSAGQWVLNITDNQDASQQRLITLFSWTLTLCPSGVVAAQGPGPLPPMPPLPDISVAISGSGISVNLTNSTTADNNNSTDPSISVRVGSMDGPATAEQHTQGLLSLLFPGFTKIQDPEGVLGVVSDAKNAGRASANTHVTDVLQLVADQSEVYKNFVNKKISDTISLINAGGTGFEGLINNRGNLFNIHDKSLKGFIQNLKAFVAADAQGKVDHVMTTASQLTALGGALTGDLKSTTGLLKQLVVAALSNTGKVYTTVEGAAKTHVDGVISAKASILEGVLDKIIAALSAAEGAKLTGPAVDLKLRLDVAKLKALQAALDKVDEAIKALPTPSQVVVGKVNAIGGFLQRTRVAELLGSLDDGPIISHLTSKVNTARDMLRKTTETVTATGN